ncbi:MAG: hypothetical protein K5894_15700 [Lachnospiraceae bacterium]|nr:hypothetical protein [Lachnospiraceae bacterium]
MQSPTSLFIEYMYNELKNNPDVKFFLTTDDEKECNRIIEEFGSDKILYISNIELKRDSVNGMQHAFADMYWTFIMW